MIIQASISWLQKDVFKVLSMELALGKGSINVILSIRYVAMLSIPISQMSKLRLRRALCYQELAEHIHPRSSAYGSDPQLLYCHMRFFK